ncbi:Hypothetical_protein [Hexamita inflata]|uniref:Hypothetical_protein n=1 Tax=Hexamita inflata TaxID=28002 RepID=A0ABP1GXE4_9EUKA
MNCTYSDLVLAIARILQIDQSANMHEKVALQTMLLSETLYKQLFDLLSTELGLQSIFLRCLFNEQIVSKHLLKSNHHDSTVSQLQSGYRLKEVFMRKQSLNAQEVQNKFVAAVKKVLKQSPTRMAMTRKFSLSKKRSPNCKENCKVNLIQRRQ